MNPFKTEEEYRAYRDKVLKEMNDHYELTGTKQEIKSLTCDECRYRLTCEFSGDDYNTNGDCLAMK